MAALCQRPDQGRCQSRQVQSALDGARTDIRASAWQGDRAGRLPRVFQSTAGAWVFPKHGQDRSGIVAGLSQVAIWGRSPCDMDSASQQAKGSSLNQGTGAGAGGRSRDAACQAVPNPWPVNRSAWKRNSGPDMGPRGLHAWDYRFSARRTPPDNEAANSGPDERHSPTSARNGICGQIIGQRDRVRREANWQHQETAATHVGKARRQGVSACASAFVRGVDGSRKCPDAEDCAIPGAYVNSRNGTDLRPLFAVIHAGRGSRRGVLACTAVHSPESQHPSKLLFLWWAVRGSNPRPSRCKQWVSVPNQELSAKLCAYFCKLSLFLFDCAPVWCTHVHNGLRRRANVTPALTTPMMEHRNG